MGKGHALLRQIVYNKAIIRYPKGNSTNALIYMHFRNDNGIYLVAATEISEHLF